MGTSVETKITNPIQHEILHPNSYWPLQFRPKKQTVTMRRNCIALENGMRTGPNKRLPITIPNKVGDCWNSCPVDCGKDMVCPGKVDDMGCKSPDMCNPGKFCPAECDWEKEMVCPGKFDAKSGEQMSGDWCMPMQNGDRWNQCPVDCGKDMMCPGAMDPKGCPMPDMC